MQCKRVLHRTRKLILKTFVLEKPTNGFKIRNEPQLNLNLPGTWVTSRREGSTPEVVPSLGRWKAEGGIQVGVDNPAVGRMQVGAHE